LSPKTKDKIRNLSRAADDVRRDQNVMRNAERETYQFERPEQELGMADLVKQHKSGDRFLYAAVTASQVEEDSSRLRRLLQHQPKLARKAIPVGNLPSLALYEEIETFSLKDLIPMKKGGAKTYINISEVLIVYGSLISTDSIFSKVKVSIVDDRLLQNKVAKSYIANTNVISKATMGLSYCFPRDEVDAISLTLSREAAFLEEGRQWGVAQLRIQMEETEFPIQLSNAPVQAINTMPQSMLEDREVDPDLIDISVMNNDRNNLQQMYLEGDLADESEPIVNKFEAAKYAKSSMAGPKGKKIEEPVGEGWGFMKDKRITGVNARDNSVDPSEDGFSEASVMSPLAMKLKSAMKKPKTDEEEFNADADSLQARVAGTAADITRVVEGIGPDDDTLRNTPSPRRVRVQDSVDMVDF